MLVLSRQRDESVRIGDNISVTVVDIRGDKVKLGFTAPVDVPVHRQEVCDRIQREGRCSHGQADQISEGSFQCRLCGARGSRVGKRVRWTMAGTSSPAEPESTRFNDADLYRRLSEPFANLDAANEAIHGFFKELRELRNKYKLPDVYCIVQGNAIHPNGSEGTFIISSQNGSSCKAEAMVAWALGFEQSTRQERIQEAMKGRGFITRPASDSSK